MRRTASSIPILALALAAQASAAQRGHVLAVHSAADAQSSSVYVLADRPLSFTTLKLSGPPRVVVDLADAEIAAADRDLAVNDGVIRRVALKQAGSRTARLVIELTQDAEFDVRAMDKRLEVRIPRAALQASGAGRPAASEAAQGAAPAAPAEKIGKAEPSDEAEKRASLPKVALVGPHQVRATETAQPPASPEGAGTAGAAVKSQPPAEGAGTAGAAVKSQPPAESEGTAGVAEKSQPPPDGAPGEASGAPADGAAPASAKPPAKDRKLAVKGQRRSITGIGFRPVRGGEVIVRSDHPLEYGVSGDGHAVLLHLPSAAIPLANNRRPLDTHFFDGPVQRVVPLAVAGGTDVRIELKSGAEYQLEQSGSVLTVTFAPSR